LINTHAGSDGAYYVTQKQHGVGTAVQSGDTVGNVLFEGFAIGAYQNLAGITAITTAALTDSNVPTDLVFIPAIQLPIRMKRCA
jgi:hypothetical protein